jgi:hypothetical protein
VSLSSARNETGASNRAAAMNQGVNRVFMSSSPLPSFAQKNAQVYRSGRGLHGLSV